MLLPLYFYYWLTRFGEIGILWPAAIAVGLWMVFVGRSWRLVLAWLLPLGLAVFVTSASKIAFIGWGLGIRSLDFTGFSGHAMFSAAIYPVLAFALSSGSASGLKVRRRWQVAAVSLAYAFAALIGYSRVVIEVHSWSEVIAGFALGAAASGCTLWLAGRQTGRPVLRWALLAVAGWLVLMPSQAAPSRAHDIVTELSVRLAGRERPFTRAELHAQHAKAVQTRRIE